ncbi:MAG TPA: hypothetical protein VMF52_09485 [Steroidobacteraceae bacterium]|nr:hypothetical protein [Steroidobacteraceae bacterium]
MKRPEDTPTSVHDYGAALESAVSWLGDRYLLATPQPRRNDIRPIYLLEAKQPPARRPARRVSH